ncbi:MAG: decarboxylase [Fibrobacteres bacterium]|jgi:glutamate/tyrosine decarboxylase-like PLP-dependent enzyme|nr:decarboxylase [Fibrobacterota bacterium]
MRGTENFEALFLGPQGENASKLMELTALAIKEVADNRLKFGSEPHGQRQENDPSNLSNPDGSKEVSLGYKVTGDRLTSELALLMAYLKKSVPAFSPRYQAHMGWDLLLPGLAGNFAAMLYNSNNVAFEGSPATTILEMLVGFDLCRMLGLNARRKKMPWLNTGEEEETIMPWGHLTGGGSISNIEALWGARNLKLLPLAIKITLDGLEASGAQGIQAARDIPVTWKDTTWRFGSLGVWELLNLEMDEALALPAKISGLLDAGPLQAAERFNNALNSNSMKMKSLQFFDRYCTKQASDVTFEPKIFLPGTKHYSFEKAAGLLGLGQESIVTIPVAYPLARMDVAKLEEGLRNCLDKKMPVLAVVAVVGSTEEGVVDPLRNILDLRKALRKEGLDFSVHVDAAWGGYHASLLRQPFEMDWAFPVAPVDPPLGGCAPQRRASQSAPVIGLGAESTRHYLALAEADSVTVDPHKQGHIPYPAGAICYRNSAIRDLVKFSAPVLGPIIPQGIAQVSVKTDELVGVFGVEGSKPGSGAAAVFLAHRMLRPDITGFGRLIGMEMYQSKLVFAQLVVMGTLNPDVRIVPLGAPASLELCGTILALDGSQPNVDLLAKMAEIGPDLNVLCYLFNFKHDGAFNQDPDLLFYFNQAIYGRLNLRPGKYETCNLILSRTLLSTDSYGNDFILSLLRELGFQTPVPPPFLMALRSTEANPWLTNDVNGNLYLSRFRTYIMDAVDEALKEVKRMQTALSDIRKGLKEQGSWLAGAPLASMLSKVGILDVELLSRNDAKNLESGIFRLIAVSTQADSNDALPREALDHFNDMPV